jgi:hypothetical protein
MCEILFLTVSEDGFTLRRYMGSSMRRNAFIGSIAFIAIGFSVWFFVKKSESLKSPVEVQTAVMDQAGASTSGESNAPNTASLAESIQRDPTSDIDTSDWEVYRGERFGFEIKLPPEWKRTTSTGDEELSFFLSSSTDIDIGFKTVTTTSTLEEVIEGLIADYMGSQYEDMEKIQIDRWTGYRKTVNLGPSSFTMGSNLYADQLFLAGNGMYCYISFNSSSESDLDALYNSVQKWEAALGTLRSI